MENYESYEFWIHQKSKISKKQANKLGHCTKKLVILIHNRKINWASR